MTCDELDALLPELFDGRLDAEQHDAALTHLATCDHCRIVVDDLQQVTRLYREHGRLRLSDEARRRIKRALDTDPHRD